MEIKVKLAGKDTIKISIPNLSLEEVEFVRTEINKITKELLNKLQARRNINRN